MKLKQRLGLLVGEGYVHLMSKYEELRYGVSLNPLSPAVWHDPYPFHARLRQLAPVYYSPTWRAWWVTEFDLVQEVLRSKGFGASVLPFPKQVGELTRNMDAERLERFHNPSMLDLDPPDHTRVRRLAQQGFIHKFIQSLEPRIRKLVDESLAGVGNEAEIDFVSVLAKPLPAIVIAEMLGLPRSDHAQFMHWAEELMLGISTIDPDMAERSIKANAALYDYFRTVAEHKRAEPGEDLMSRLIAAEDEGGRLNGPELYNTCVLLLLAGHETTTRLISNGLYLLLQHPEQQAWLRQQPENIPGAVEEMLRFEPPVQATRRFVLEDMDFHGCRFKRGQLVFVSIAGANRDPGANDEPDKFDLRRTDLKQVAFGYGIHHCIGASLARLEARVVFEEIFRRYQSLALVNPNPVWGSSTFFRGHEELIVNVNA